MKTTNENTEVVSAQTTDEIKNMKTNELGGWIVPSNSEIPAGTVIPDHSELGAYCRLGDGCVLGDNCVLGDWCHLGPECSLGDACELGDGCRLDDGCRLGDWCNLGRLCRLGDWCRLGNDCRLGPECSLGDVCIWEGAPVVRFLTLANVAGSGRQITLIQHVDGVLVRAGRFLGTPEKFAEQSKAEGKELYAAAVTAIVESMLATPVAYKTNAAGGWIVPAHADIPSGTVIPAHSELGDWCHLGDRCTLGTECKLGDICTLGDGCRLGNDCRLGDNCIMGNECRLGDWCHLGTECRLGAACTLGQWCCLGDSCVLGARCKMRAYCKIGNLCRLGSACTLGKWCRLGNSCVLGDRCRIGDSCRLGDRCKLGSLCHLGSMYTLGKDCDLGSWCKLPLETEPLGPVGIVLRKGICPSSLVKCEGLFESPASDGRRAVSYGISGEGGLIAFFKGDREAEFINPRCSAEFVSDIRGKEYHHSYMESGMWLGGPAVTALKDLASRSAPSVWHCTETGGKVYIKQAGLGGFLTELVEAANGPAYIPLACDAH